MKPFPARDVEYKFENVLDNFPSGENERHNNKILANSSISMVAVKYPSFVPKRYKHLMQIN